VDITRSINAKISTQPAKYQIANYNVFPSPTLNVDTALPKNQTVSAKLLECTTKKCITGGFKTGDVQSVLPGVKAVQFTGLKLNKISVIKSQLSTTYSKESTFCIQFSIGSAVWESEPFKVVSSFAQLPAELQEERPFKKGITNQEEETAEEEIQEVVEQTTKFSIDFLVNPVNTPIAVASSSGWTTK